MASFSGSLAFAGSAIAFMSMATPAAAQDEQAAAPDQAQVSQPGAETGGEIIVTAQRRAERLQDVPIAITALGSDQLAQRGAVDLANLVGAVPGLSISGFTGANGSNVVSIRGVTGQVLAIGSGQATAIYIDGVYLSRPDAAFFALDDVERIEVLRGPQGALYGRNATAGAINIITREPGTELQGGGELSYGNFDTVSARASLTGPLGGGFSAGISGGYNRHDGYIRNTVTGNRLNDREAYTLRGKLRFTSSDDRFSAVLAGDYVHDDATPVFKNSILLPSGEFVGIGNPEEFSSDAATEAQTQRRTINKGVSLTLNYEASNTLDLVSITAFRDIDVLAIYDADGSQLPALVAGTQNDSQTFSQEIRAVYTGDRFRATVGANVFTEDASFGLSVVPPTGIQNFATPFDTSDLTAWAIFSQLEFDLTDQLTLVGGLRYNNEKRDFTVDYRGAPVPGPLFTGTVSDEKLIPSIGVNFKPSSDVLIYGKISQGYQAPGFNFAPGPTASEANTFGAETLWAYEVGAKTQFFDRRATLNVAGFWYDYSDIQVRSTIGVGLTRVDNAASATLKGIEASFDLTPLDGLSLGVQATYLHARYGDFCQPISGGDPQAMDPLCSPGLADRSGNRLNLAPTWSGGINAGYETEVGNAGKLSASVTYDFASSVFYVGAANEEELRSGSWGALGARIGFQLRNGPEIFVYGKNLTDERHLAFIGRVAPTSAPEVMNDPRTYGIGISYHF